MDQYNMQKAGNDVLKAQEAYMAQMADMDAANKKLFAAYHVEQVSEDNLQALKEKKSAYDSSIAEKERHQLYLSERVASGDQAAASKHVKYEVACRTLRQARDSLERDLAQAETYHRAAASSVQQLEKNSGLGYQSQIDNQSLDQEVLYESPDLASEEGIDELFNQVA